MNKKLILTLAFFATLFFSFSSCNSKEEKVISRLASLTERIDKNGANFSSDDWLQAFRDLEDIHEDMKDCDFTSEQLKEVARADGRITAIVAKQGAKAFSQEAASFMKELGSIVKEFKEGAQEIFNEENMKEIEEEFEKVLKDLEKDLDD